MRAFEALLFSHPIDSLLIVAAGFIWLTIYIATRATEQDTLDWRFDGPLTSDPASDDRRHDDQ